MQEDKQNQQRIDVNIDYGGDAFYCDSITVNAGGGKFVIDFKQTTPRVDQVGGQNRTTFVIKHKAVVMDPVLAKEFLRIFKDSVERYESGKGEIKVPKQIILSDKSEKPKKFTGTKTKTISTDQEIYVG